MYESGSLFLDIRFWGICIIHPTYRLRGVAMPDIATIGAALGSIRSAYDIAKIIKDSSSSLAEAEVNLKLADLINALAEAKFEIAEVQDLLLEKDRAIKELEEELKLKANREYEPPYYWLNKEDGTKDGPYCQPCFDTGGRYIRLQAEGNGSWRCLACKTYFHDKNHIPRGPISARPR